MTDTTQDFRDLMAATLRLNAAMIRALSPEQQDALIGAVAGGARLYIQAGPLPAFESVELVLIEREGTRHKIGEVRCARPPIQ